MQRCSPSGFPRTPESGLVGDVVSILMAARGLGIVVAVVQIVLQCALFLGHLGGVLRRGRRIVLR